MDDCDDIFDEVTNARSKAYEEGFVEGEKNGQKSAFLQGFKIGQNTAFNICNELGHYYGSCQVYAKQVSSNLESNEKGLKLCNQLCEQISSFDYSDCHSSNFTIKLTLIRSKFKQFCSITNTKNYFNKSSLSTVSMNF